MARVVQKYGGTSVKDLECIRNVAKRIKEKYDSGDEIIVVVSARAGMTNRLIADAKSLSNTPNQRELDALLCIGEQETAALLAIALNEIGVKAVSQLAFQAGIQTCSSHGNARIENIDGGKIEELLSKKNVVIVAGFQGIDKNCDLTTLGRGGSDLTALALAHKFKADLCEIYTDVEGVYTGDPKTIKNAKLIEKIDFDSLLRLSFFDNKIMQDRSIAFAQKNSIPFSISSTFKMLRGTDVIEPSAKYESCVIGITNRKDLCLVSCEFLQDNVLNILEFFKKNGVEISFIKHRAVKNSEFFDEICLNMFDFETFKDKFLEKFEKRCKCIKISTNLSRIDVVGTNIQGNEKALQTFDVISKKSILRSEYGKHGLSFLLNTADYEALLNEIHDMVFAEEENRS